MRFVSFAAAAAAVTLSFAAMAADSAPTTTAPQPGAAMIGSTTAAAKESSTSATGNGAVAAGMVQPGTAMTVQPTGNGGMAMLSDKQKADIEKTCRDLNKTDEANYAKCVNQKANWTAKNTASATNPAAAPAAPMAPATH